MTARDVYNNALVLLDEVDDDGDISYNAAYEAKAPRLLSMLQCEIARAEGVEPSVITSLGDELVVSDDSAGRIMPYGLASSLALTDQLIEYYSAYENVYRSLLRAVGVSESGYVDETNVMSGF